LNRSPLAGFVPLGDNHPPPFNFGVTSVMNRGDRREPIFHDDTDRKRFVTTLGEVCTKTGWQVASFKC
jgi:hypothetical protein